MTTPTTIQTLAAEVSSLFRTEKRNDGTEFITYDGELSDWITAMIRAAHDDMAPDDWKYAFVVEALDALAADDDADPSSVTLEADVYTHDLLRWLASNLQRPGYCDQAVEDYGITFAGTVELIQAGQAYEKEQVLGCVRSALEDRLESMEDEDTAEDEASEEIEEGDITTPDGRTFYQYGKLWLEADEDATSEEISALIRAKMEAENFYPNAWMISDHGNIIPFTLD